MIPKSGGEYAYLMEALHPIFPFLFSWISAWILKPAGVAVITLTCAEYVLVPLFNDDCGSPPALNIKLLAITVIRKLSIWPSYSHNPPPPPPTHHHFNNYSTYYL